MGKRILVTSTDLMMIQFLVPHVRYLSENGFDVEVACSDVGGRMDEVRAALDGAAKAIHTVRLHRSPAAAENLKGYGDMKRVIASGRYDIVWTNEPVMGVVTRFAARKARKTGTRVVYMAHGFHFFKGAPLLSWAVFYPVERLCARLTDAIITINKEDYRRAGKFHTPKIYKIPGVGIDTTKFRTSDAFAGNSPSAKRSELELPADCFLMLSVGELSKRKNHAVAIRALALLNDPSIYYVICGKGKEQAQLAHLADSLGVGAQVRFLGYRRDIPEICQSADCFVFPSLQEGLPFALMEAMESGLPIVCSNIRGNRDLIVDPSGGILCDPHSPQEFAKAILTLKRSDTIAMTAFNRQKLVEFDLPHSQENVMNILLKSLH